MFEADEAELRRTLRKRFRVDLSALKSALNALADGGDAG
jgi:hypothetical protein